MKTSLFAEVANPKHRWREKLCRDGGSTALPTEASKVIQHGFPTPLCDSTLGDVAVIQAPGESDTPLERMVRLHEVMHARFTEDIKDNIASKYLSVVRQIAEDIRLKKIGERRDIFMPDAYITKEIIKKVADGYYREAALGAAQSTAIQKPQSEIACFYAGSQGYPIEDNTDLSRFDVFEEVTGLTLEPRTRFVLKRWKKQIRRANRLRTPVPHFNRLAEATDSALRLLGPVPPIHHHMKEILIKMLPGKKKGKRKPGFPPKDSPRISRAHRLGQDIELLPEDRKLEFIKANEAIWGKMTLRIAPLLRHFKATTKREGSAAPDGSVPKHWQRWYLDKSVWERKGRRLGGTLLIDISSSMSWAQSLTEQLIEALPAMTIAVYSGKGATGDLTIIAKDGRVAAAGEDWRQNHGGGNAVDGPALEWLAKQAKPRVWFSDGEVTGWVNSGTDESKEYQSPRLFEEAARLCRLGAIRRMIAFETVRDFFQGQPRQGLSPNPNHEDNNDADDGDDVDDLVIVASGGGGGGGGGPT